MTDQTSTEPIPDLLRRAAKVCRDHAAAFPDPSQRWRPTAYGVATPDGTHLVDDFDASHTAAATFMHAALLDPAVALALAALLDEVAAAMDDGDRDVDSDAVPALARTILREGA